MKIPKTAKKVFSGIICDVYQWEQKMFDGSFQTFEMLKRPDTVNVIPINDRGEVILAREQQPGKIETIGCLGGRVEKGEKPLEAARRELLEEAGISASKYKLWFTYRPSEKMAWTIYVYIARDLSYADNPQLDPGEKISKAIYSFDDFIDRTIFLEDFRDQEVATKIMREGKAKVKAFFSF